MNPLTLVWHFALHIFIGTLLFILIGGAAVALHLFVGAVQQIPGLDWAVGVLKLIEYLVFGLDVLSYVWYLFRVSWAFIMDIKDAT
jgi:hypothetical protein